MFPTSVYVGSRIFRGSRFARPCVHERRPAGAFAPKAGKVDAWTQAVDYLNTGRRYEGTVQSSNRGGIIIDCWGVQGFMPNSMLTSEERPLIGSKIAAMFVEVDELRNRLILSQRQLDLVSRMESLVPGTVVEGEVSWIEGYGAFVDVLLGDGHTVSGLIHKSELSWSQVNVPENIVSVGEVVKCKVMSLDPLRRPPRVALSLRRMLPDPLKVNVASAFSTNRSELAWNECDKLLPEFESIVDAIRSSDGVNDIQLLREASVPSVSQELELWLGPRTHIKEQEYRVVAVRLGATVQEFGVKCSLSQEELRSVLDRALSAYQSLVSA